MAYNADTERLVRRVRADLALVTDQQTRELVSAWVTAWNEVAPDLEATLLQLLTSGDRISRAMLMRSTRLQKVLNLIAGRLETLTAEAQVRIIGDLRAVIDIAGGAQRSIIDSQLPANARHLVDIADWTQVNAHGLEAIVNRSTTRIHSRFRPLSREAELAVRRELVRGYAAGANPRQTASRIVARTEGRFNGGLTRALAIARTETLDASRAGGHIGRIQNADVLRGWEWHCELTVRSCQACISQHGTLHPLDEPGPNDHVNGRCTGVPVIKSWAELGIDLPEPTSTRRSGEQWFNSQPPASQKQILGPGRYQAWKAGDYPVSDWSRVQQNPDWRPSLQTTSAPAAYSGGRSGSVSRAS